MSSLTKIAAERNQKTLLELVVQPGNDICADCKARSPRWASHNLGVFLCVNCASIHRKLGTHITKVKSITMDTWTKEQVEIMKSTGNRKSNTIYNPNEIRNPPPLTMTGAERDSELEQFIRSKYQFKRFMDRSAMTSSKLGPSQSLSSVSSSGSSRSVSTPLTSYPGPSSFVSSTQRQPVRPSTVATTSSPRSVLPPSTFPKPTLQPASQTSTLSQSRVPANTGTVWEDLISLQTSPTNSSLPLQYQLTSQASVPVQQTAFTGSMTQYPQEQQLAPDTFPHLVYATSGIQSSGQFQIGASLPPNTHQPLFPTQTAYVQSSAQNAQPFFQPQPQQVQDPISGQGFFGASNTPGAFMSIPPAHMSSSNNVLSFRSHSPQPTLSTTPQPVQPIYSTALQPQPQTMPMAAFGQARSFASSTDPIPPQQGLVMGSQFTPTQQMRMAQQQQAYPQLSGQFGNNSQGQPFNAAGFSISGQWGAT